MADVLPSEELVEEPSDYGALQTGTRLGRYEMLVPIARGGMARVWAARLHGQRGFQKLVAIKVILPHLAEEPEFERMFLDEARIASGVHHPNVCEIYELGEEKKTLYLVMEWVSGDSFARVLRSAGKTEALDPRVAARVIADACAGVHAAHELTDDDGRALGVVHRDLSPHNILLTNDGTAKVCDFGVAKALGQLHEATSAGQLKGKIAYMAPEQITGAAVDRRSDVFSLGCVLYEATTGQRPFRGDGDHQVMHAVLKGEFALPTSLVRNYPQELERIVMRALAPTPLLRFPTAERMRFALEEYVARGQLVTQSNVAQVLRSRIGPLIERRKERIRQASSAGDGESAWSDPPGNMTPSNQAKGGHRSGVKASNPHHHQQTSPPPPPPPPPPPAGRPLFSTTQMDRPEAVAALVRLAAASEAGPPNAPPSGYGVQPGSSTIPHAAPSFQPQHQQQLGHTPVSHPAASYPGASHPPGAPHSAPPAQAFSMPPQQPSMSSGPPAPTSQPFFGTALLQPPTGMPHFTLPPKSSVPPQSSSPFDAPADPAYDLGVSGESPHEQQQQQGAGHYAVAVGIGILVAAIIGGGGFYVWRGGQKPVEIAAPSTTTTVAAGALAPPSPSPAASTIAPASADITFRLTPADATLLVEGRELPPDVRTIARPQIGKTVNVVVRARGHEDVTTLVDFFTSSPMDLDLKAPDPTAAAPPKTVAAAAPPGEAPAKDLTPKEAPPAKDPTPREPSRKPPRPAKDPGLPANPY